MEYLFSTPLGLAIVFVLWMTLTHPKISSKWWAKLGKWLCLGYVGLFFWSAHLAMTEKSYIGRTKSDAHIVTVFTKEVSRLIAEHKNQQAKELLDKFNQEYAVLAGRPELKKFVDDLIHTAKRE